jgi:hypothetical protein
MHSPQLNQLLHHFLQLKQWMSPQKLYLHSSNYPKNRHLHLSNRLKNGCNPTATAPKD